MQLGNVHGSAYIMYFRLEARLTRACCVDGRSCLCSTSTAIILFAYCRWSMKGAKPQAFRRLRAPLVEDNIMGACAVFAVHQHFIGTVTVLIASSFLPSRLQCLQCQCQQRLACQCLLLGKIGVETGSRETQMTLILMT
jgi:hypothetical protein